MSISKGNFEQQPAEAISTNEKLRWEIEKLQAETKELRRPFFLKPGLLIPIFVAVFGVVIQYYRSDRDYKLAEIQRQQAVLDTKQLNEQKRQYLVEISNATASLNQLQEQQKETQEKLASAQRELAKLSETAGASDPSNAKLDVKKVVTRINTSLTELSQANQQVADQSARTARNLQALSGNLRTSLTPLVYLQIVSEMQRDAAQKVREQLQQQGFDAPGIENISSKAIIPTKNEVRYFHDPEDKEEAQRLLTLLQNTFDLKDARLHYVQWNYVRPRQYEVWLVPVGK